MRDEDGNRARRKRNIALALVLAGVCVLFYLMSIVQWHEHFGRQ
ncbi:MAG TPA: hypothetical protein VGM26_01845 [Rhizomicrobium sp.]